MHLRPPKIQIPDENPFQYDLLERESISESLTELVKSSADGLVLALHAPWGSGKTTFLSMWKQHLKNSRVHTLYFNAWESDFTDDPLVALIGELEVGLSELKLLNAAATRSATAVAVSKVKRIGTTLLKRSLPAAVKLATAGMLDLSDITEETLGELAERTAESEIEAYEESRRSITKFREAIEEVARHVGVLDNEGERLPLVLIVDELDRCKPSYAVRVLECIKHLFAVPGVVFVLAVDRTQLSHSVRSQYGIGMDANGYLRRFFDIELSLPEPTGQRFSDAQFDRFGLTEVFKERGTQGEAQVAQSNLQEVFPELFKAFSCSLRERERSFSLLAFALRATPKNKLLLPVLLATLIVLKVKDPDLYQLLASRAVEPEAVIERIKKGPGGADLLSSRQGEILEALLFACCGSAHDMSPVLQHFRAIADHPEQSPQKMRAASILELFKFYELRSAAGTFNYMLGKIDLVASK